MRVFLLFTVRGPLVILMSYESIVKPGLLEELRAKGIEKFMAWEISLDRTKERYGGHFFVAEHDFFEADDFRILDEDGARAFRLFPFSDLGPLTVHEGAA